MAFDIRSILSRSLGGPPEREAPTPVAAPEEITDEEAPGSPIEAASSSAANPDAESMLLGGANRATVLIPEGIAALPSAAVDDTHSGLEDDAIETDEAKLIAEVAIGAALIAGPIDGEERADLLESLREVPALEEFSEDELDDIVEALGPPESEKDVEDYVARMEDRLDEIAMELTDPVLRRAAYQLAVYFSAWDGELTDEEMDYLEAAADAFEIPDHEAHWLREATLTEAGEEGLQHQAAEPRPG